MASTHSRIRTNCQTFKHSYKHSNDVPTIGYFLKKEKKVIPITFHEYIFLSLFFIFNYLIYNIIKLQNNNNNRNVWEKIADAQLRSKRLESSSLGCFRPKLEYRDPCKKPPRSSRWTQKSGSSRGNGFRQLVLCARDSSTMTLLLVCLASLCHRLIPPRTRQSPREREGGVEWPSSAIFAFN